MSKPKGYNGWKNYETWCVALWIDNDQGSQEYWKERADDIIGTLRPYQRSAAIVALAAELRDFFEENMPELEGMWADLMNAALGEVDWYEIAETRFEE